MIMKKFNEAIVEFEEMGLINGNEKIDWKL